MCLLGGEAGEDQAGCDGPLARPAFSSAKARLDYGLSRGTPEPRRVRLTAGARSPALSKRRRRTAPAIEQCGGPTVGPSAAQTESIRLLRLVVMKQSNGHPGPVLPKNRTLALLLRRSLRFQRDEHRFPPSAPAHYQIRCTDEVDRRTRKLGNLPRGLRVAALETALFRSL